MFGLKKKKVVQPTPKKPVEKKYKQRAVTPAAHEKTSKMALKKKTTMIDIVDQLAGV